MASDMPVLARRANLYVVGSTITVNDGGDACGLCSTTGHYASCRRRGIGRQAGVPASNRCPSSAGRPAQRLPAQLLRVIERRSRLAHEGVFLTWTLRLVDDWAADAATVAADAAAVAAVAAAVAAAAEDDAARADAIAALALASADAVAGSAFARTTGCCSRFTSDFMFAVIPCSRPGITPAVPAGLPTGRSGGATAPGVPAGLPIGGSFGAVGPWLRAPPVSKTEANRPTTVRVATAPGRERVWMACFTMRLSPCERSSR